MSPITAQIDLVGVQPLPNAFAHNDYWQKNPLWDALSHGFTAIEVDVHYSKGKLIIAHNKPTFIHRKRLLSKQYLKPLWKLYKKQKGKIYPNYANPILLIIDFKSKAIPTYQCLLKELKPYQKMLTRTEGGELQLGAVTVIISGNRPVDIISQQEDGYVFLDGRINDKELSLTSSLMPVVSENWRRFFGHIAPDKKIPKRDLEIIKLMVKVTHLEGKKLRFWNTPEHKNIWTQLLQIGVDYINTDQLDTLSHFLKTQTILTYEEKY